MKCSSLFLNLQRPWHEYEHNFQIMYKVGMGHKPPIPEKLSTEGKDFLSHCLESEPKRRWTASMLLDHPFVKVRRHYGGHFKRSPVVLRCDCQAQNSCNHKKNPQSTVVA